MRPGEVVHHTAELPALASGRNCPDMTSALNELIAGATTVESCRSSRLR